MHYSQWKISLSQKLVKRRTWGHFYKRSYYLKAVSNCGEVVKKANRILGMIRRNFQDKSDQTILPLYLWLGHKIEYCIQARRPYLKKDIEQLERVQKRVTSLVNGFRHLHYDERLQKLGLVKIEKRFKRADMIETFKILHGLDKCDSSLFFILDKGVCIGHSLKLIKKWAR